MLSYELKMKFLELCHQLTPETLGELTPEAQRVEYDRIMSAWRKLEIGVGRRVSAFEVLPMATAASRMRTGALHGI